MGALEVTNIKGHIFDCPISMEDGGRLNYIADLLTIAARIHVRRPAHCSRDPSRKLQAGPPAAGRPHPELVELMARPNPEGSLPKILNAVQLVDNHQTVKASVVKKAVGSLSNNQHRLLAVGSPPKCPLQVLHIFHVHQVLGWPAYSPAAVLAQGLSQQDTIREGKAADSARDPQGARELLFLLLPVGRAGGRAGVDALCVLWYSPLASVGGPAGGESLPRHGEGGWLGGPE
mmetsp:Transcript_34029/g.96400  ORF Transcript_34029/g.96400 Transcript_34029/m.96400 type:complete len:232 (-) Transcript_34029:10-705(-)